LKLATQSTEELITLCKKQDKKAQFEMYDRYCLAMYNVVFRIIKDKHYAEDIMQDGFLKAFVKINDFKEEVAFGAWLKRIMVNSSIDFCKKKAYFHQEDFSNKLVLVADSCESDSDSTDFTDLKVKQIIEVLHTLKESYRMILTLFYIEGYDQEEISEILNISYSNCRTTLSRAKENLRFKLREI
jgi:RNA polymerase sigma-70 factor (ECF subfamily)